MQALLGIDVGTSGCKVIATSLNGGIIAQASHSYKIDYPRQGWAEQDPQLWYEAACKAIRECLELGRLNAARVQALAITGPAHHVALLGADGKVLRPTIHWSDLRSAPQCDKLAADWGERLFEITGQRFHPSWTLPQLIWLKENEPDTWKRLARVLVTKDYVRHRLTGDFLTDPYDAVGTMLCDLRKVAWSDEITDYLGLPKSALPEIRPAAAMAGKLTPQAARDTGLNAGTPVAVGSGDSAVEAFGSGAVRAGDCMIKLGSSANVDLVTPTTLASPKTITYPYFVDSLGFTVTATISGASSWRWFREQAITPAGSLARMTNEELMSLAVAAGPGAEGLMFHPYLMGERVPYWDPTLRGSFVGISARHHVGHFARAVLEGVAFSLCDCMAAVEALGPKALRFKLLGGGSSNPLWNQIISDVLGKPLARPEVGDASIGAALLAGHAVGVYPDWQSAAAAFPSNGEQIRPRDENREIYARLFGVYQDSVAALKSVSGRLQQATAATPPPAQGAS
jgi:xylulokinase